VVARNMGATPGCPFNFFAFKAPFEKGGIRFTDKLKKLPKGFEPENEGGSLHDSRDYKADDISPKAC
jgi:hypothetical protein